MSLLLLWMLFISFDVCFVWHCYQRISWNDAMQRNDTLYLKRLINYIVLWMNTRARASPSNVTFPSVFVISRMILFVELISFVGCLQSMWKKRDRKYMCHMRAHCYCYLLSANVLTNTRAYTHTYTEMCRERVEWIERQSKGGFGVCMLAICHITTQITHI